MSEIELKLESLGLVLPQPIQVPAGVVLPFSWVRVCGNRAYVSGHIALNADGSLAEPLGKVGEEVTAEQGYQAARLVALAILASLKRELGDLDTRARAIDFTSAATQVLALVVGEEVRAAAVAPVEYVAGGVEDVGLKGCAGDPRSDGLEPPVLALGKADANVEAIIEQGASHDAAGVAHQGSPIGTGHRIGDPDVATVVEVLEHLEVAGGPNAVGMQLDEVGCAVEVDGNREGTFTGSRGLQAENLALTEAKGLEDVLTGGGLCVGEAEEAQTCGQADGNAHGY